MPREVSNQQAPARADGHARGLPEITAKAVVLGVALSMVLAGANAYLGLLAGMTVSASIPAAVISMGVLRCFRRSNVLENNIVQTAASAGEALAAGVVFTFPALVILGAWSGFNYLETTVIAGLGGLLGVLFTVPLRRALIVEAGLAFPEGVATAQVLSVGRSGRRGLWAIAGGGALGAAAKLGETGLELWQGAVEAAVRVGGSVLYVGTNLAPALVGVGYIVGLRIAALVFLGGAANWLVAIPILAAFSPWPATEAGEPMSAVQGATFLWSTRTRYIGVGAMLVGGLWAVGRLWGSVRRGVASGLAAYRELREKGSAAQERAERDAPMPWVGLAVGVSAVPLFFVFWHVAGRVGVAAVMAVVMLVAGFLFSAVASYMAGLVGSSNNPVSGVTIATILVSALLLLALGTGAAGPAAAILIGGVVCCAAAIGGDSLQDLKTGHLVGATPWKQQVMQGVGVLAAALVVAPILSLLLHAYGIGERTAAHPNALAAPQATLMASVARGVFARDLPWATIAVGAGLGVGVIALDAGLERRGSRFRTPVLAVAVGVYLPFRLGVAILAGGLVAAAARRGDHGPAAGRGVLLAAGLITGEALAGILLAVPIVANRGQNPLALAGDALPLAWPGALLMLGVVVALYRVATRPPPADQGAG
ncbi:MAG: OPT family oligopeptide transporter [Candidatus Brocadiia bacterium]